MYIYVCVYIHIYTYIHSYKNTHITYTYRQTYTYTYTYIYTQKHTKTHTMHELGAKAKKKATPKHRADVGTCTVASTTSSPWSLTRLQSSAFLCTNRYTPTPLVLFNQDISSFGPSVPSLLSACARASRSGFGANSRNREPSACTTHPRAPCSSPWHASKSRESAEPVTFHEPGPAYTLLSVFLARFELSVLLELACISAVGSAFSSRARMSADHRSPLLLHLAGSVHGMLLSLCSN